MSCILWKGAVNSGGYPITWRDGKTVYVHRILLNAKSHEVVMHSCDVPSCVNPKHLSIGSHKENSEDMIRKNRQAKGERCARSKYKQWQVDKVREFKGILSSRKTAAFFGMSKTNVLDIWNNRIWKINE